MKPAGVTAGRDPFRADRRPRAMNTKLLPRSGRRRDIYIREPACETFGRLSRWMKNGGVIRISSIFIRGSSRGHGTGGLQEGRAREAR